MNEVKLLHWIRNRRLSGGGKFGSQRHTSDSHHCCKYNLDIYMSCERRIISVACNSIGSRILNGTIGMNKSAAEDSSGTHLFSPLHVGMREHWHAIAESPWSDVASTRLIGQVKEQVVNRENVVIRVN